MFNVLLQVLDDGRLTDGQGRTVDFKNTVVIMTSNVGSQAIAPTWAAGGGVALRGDEAPGHGRLRGTFRPEFLNRIDEVIVFHALTDEDLARIVDLLLADLGRRLAEHDLAIELTPAARAIIAREGNDPQFGARPLKRTMQRLVENPLARGLLRGPLPPRGSHRVDADPIGGTLLFTPEGATVVADAGNRRDARSGAGVGSGSGGAVPAPSILDPPATEPTKKDDGAGTSG